MKCGQLIENNIRNNFFEKSYPKCGREISHIPFSGKNWAYLWIIKVLHSSLLFHPKLRAILSVDHLLLPHIKHFNKIKRSHNIRRKIFLLLYSINWPSFIVWLPLLREILRNMCIANVFQPALKLKLVSAIFYQIFIFSPNGSPLKTMKNVFDFI